MDRPDRPQHPPVPADLLRWRCRPEDLGFASTEDLGDAPIRIIGQPRALDALRLGLEVEVAGYNVFVVGEVGTGRSTTVRSCLDALDLGDLAPADLVYVHNFKDPDQPRLLTFPAGKGSGFRKAMADLVAALRKGLPDLFESDAYRARRSSLVENAKGAQKERVKAFERKVEAEGFALVQVQAGPMVRPDLVPVVAGNPVDLDQIETLVEQGTFVRKEYEKLKAKRAKLQDEMEALTKEVHAGERAFRQALSDLDREQATAILDAALADVRDDFEGKEVGAYLDEVREDVLEHLDRFRRQDEPASSGEREEAQAALREAMLPYAVNLLVDHTGTTRRPVLWETAPTYRNLFGAIEKARTRDGEWRTDHTRIKAGSLLRASGGFLVLDALDLLAEPGVWPALKRTLRTRMVEIQGFDPLHIFAGVSLKPQAVPIDLKVILIGTHHIYRLLYHLDEDFQKIFKVKAEFALETPLSAEEIGNYAAFIRKKTRDDALPPFRSDAVAAVVEESVRMAGRKERLTTRFREVADLVAEAGYWARQESAPQVTEAHVDRAVAQRIRRVDLVEEKLRERIAEGTVLLDLQGEKVGQVNGLVVLDVGDHVFGSPTRITATTAVGRAGIIDIERRADLSGAIHTKGVLILAGWLRATFSQDKPLSLSATLCFEQSYGGVDGDSASSAELYALLSSLSGVPLRQGIAVTGSVNQKGEVQPIGGVNEKVEGFFDLVRAAGVGDGHGVMIPARNLEHLMLRKDLVQAAGEGRFRVDAVSRIEEGIEILTGRPADEVLRKADARLRELAEAVRAYGPADLALDL